MASLRESLLAALAIARDMEAALVAACDDPPPAEPERWTGKDHLAHVSFYREYVAGVLDAVHTGGPLPPLIDETALDERNAAILAEHRAKPAAEVRERAGASYELLRRALEACSEDDLRQPRPGGEAAFSEQLWQMVPGCNEYHVGQHLVYWHLERGEADAAERAARRAYQAQTTLYEDPRFRADATYNLGCAYALMGRPEEALALVTESFAGDPRLRAWALEDPELLTIHHLLAP